MAGWGECGIAGGGCQLDRSQPLCRVSPECQRLCSSRQPVHCSSEQQKIEQHSGHFNEVCGTKKTVRGSCGELNTSQYSRDQTHQTHQTQGRHQIATEAEKVTESRAEAVRGSRLSPAACHSSPHLLLLLLRRPSLSYSSFANNPPLTSAWIPSQPLLRPFFIAYLFFLAYSSSLSLVSL